MLIGTKWCASAFSVTRWPIPLSTWSLKTLHSTQDSSAHLLVRGEFAPSSRSNGQHRCHPPSVEEALNQLRNGLPTHPSLLSGFCQRTAIGERARLYRGCDGKSSYFFSFLRKEEKAHHLNVTMPPAGSVAVAPTPGPGSNGPLRDSAGSMHIGDSAV